MSASEFRAKCLKVLKRLRNHSLSRVTVRHRGTPVASDWVSELQRDMKGSVTIPEGVDLTEPIFAEEFDAEKGILHR